MSSTSMQKAQMAQMHAYVGFSQVRISKVRVMVMSPCNLGYGYEIWCQKITVPGLPVGESCMILGSLILMQCDGQTDRQT